MVARRTCLGLALLAALAGCGNPPERVWVDHSRVPPDPDRFGTPTATPKPPAGLPARTGSLPALPARTFADESSPRMAQALAEVERNRRDATRQLRNRLIRLAESELRRRREALRGELDADREARLKEIDARIRAEFERVALLRGELLTRYTFLVASPRLEPVPPPPTGDSPVLRERYTEGLLLRSEIIALDAAYLESRRALQASGQAELDRLLTDFEVRLARLAEEARQRAADEADELLRRSYENINLRPGTEGDLRLPAVAGAQVTRPATRSPRPAPKLDFEPLSTPAEQRAMLERDARIWAESRGYELVRGRAGRDATKEFLEWRTRHRAGL